MPPHQPALPLLWLISDVRNDAGLEAALQALPRGSGFVFRHYHLDGERRAARFAVLAQVARETDHLVILSEAATQAREWGADGIYGGTAPPDGGNHLIWLATAHDGEELAAAAQADGVFLSPVFPTRSHPASQTLGIHGFHVLAQQSPVPVIALGGMTKARAEELQWPRWGAIDGLASPLST